MALARVLEPASNAQPSAVTAGEPTAIEPWAETVLFGTVAELKKLLDDGLDPNATTKTGGTTLLMMAAPDVAKMRLLADRDGNSLTADGNPTSSQSRAPARSRVGRVSACGGGRRGPVAAHLHRGWVLFRLGEVTRLAPLLRVPGLLTLLEELDASDGGVTNTPR